MTDLITTNIPPPTTSHVGFDYTPVSVSPITFVVGGDVFASDAHSVAINEAITFTAETDLEAVDYEWDFGDGHKAHGEEVVHTFTIPNPHQRVSLRVMDSSGKHASCSKVVYLEDASLDPPTVVRF